MDTDIINSHGFAFLGSYLKRISDRFLNDAAKIHNFLSLEINPSQMVTLNQINAAKRISVNNLAILQRLSQPAITRNLNDLTNLGLIEMEHDENDQRVKFFSLTESGKDLIKEFEVNIRDKVQIIIEDIFEKIDPNFLDKLKNIEKALDEKSFEQRFKEFNMSNIDKDEVEIVHYSDDLAKDFYEVNADWIQERFILEDIDKEVLSNPKEKILDSGGIILFARHPKLGTIGTCALMNMGNAYELTKMGVTARARGKKIGEKLLTAILAEAKNMKIKRLFLLTNSRQKEAIHLYEKLGFIHSQEIMDEYGHEYERCDVAMLYAP